MAEETRTGSSPNIDHRDLKITDFCDMEKFSRMMQDWAIATGLAVAAVDNDFNYLCDFYNFTEFCAVYNRGNPQKKNACIRSDQNGHGIYRCHAGLIDFTSPITLTDGTVLGAIYGGQVLPSVPDEERYRQDARKNGIDEENYIQALHKVNIRTPQQIESSAALLTRVINTFVRSSYNAMINEESLNVRSQIIASLSHIYFLNYYIDLTHHTFLALDVPAKIHEAVGTKNTADALLKTIAMQLTEKEETDGLLNFHDLSTLPERLQDRASIAYEFISTEYKWCRAVFITVSQDDQNRPDRVLYAVQQINEEKESELKIQKELKDAAEEAIKANRAKSEFLSRMSHDIRTPMNGIIGMTHIALEQENNPRTTDCLKKIGRSSDYLLGLINDVLDMSRIESGEIVLNPQPYPDEEFDEYMDSVLLPLADAKRQIFVPQKHVRQDIIPILDKLRFNQIIFNLVSNAIKYTPDGGSILYDGVSQIVGDQLELTITVSDNGQGMSESFQKILFEPYTQEDRIRTMKAQNTGSGLGLAIVKKLATLMNGTITVQSQINQGSTFTLTLHLPYITREDYQKENKETVSEDTVSLQGKRILVCEDNEINQEIVQSILSRYQMQADIAPNGIIGRNLFEKSAPGYYYAVLMDLRMPMMDGYDTAQSIRTMAREDAGTIPIIAMTADVFSEDIAHCLAAGMNDHLAKPLEPGVLYEKLKKYQ